MSSAPIDRQVPLIDGGPIVHQRLTLVLPSTGEFDSRTYRIATSCVARGHAVTIIARWRPGLADEEHHPSGYVIRRVQARAVDGLPGWRSFERYRSRRLAGRPGAVSGMADPVRGAVTSEPPAPPSRLERILRLPRRAAWLVARRFSLVLVTRAQTAAALAVAGPADLYHGMAYTGIPVALALRKRHGGRVVYDARDIYVDARSLARAPRPLRWLVARSERRAARAADRVVTVNDAYADVMTSRFGTPRPLVVRNCSYRFEPPRPKAHLLHEALGLDRSTRIVLYHGGLTPDRGIEELLEAIVHVDRAALVIMGYGELEDELRRASAAPGLAGRVFVMAAVAPDVLHDWVASADVAAMPIQPSSLNHRLTTPNKLFEAMTAGVPVVASDLPGMASIVAETGCGVLCDPTDPLSIAAAIRQILDADENVRDEIGARGHRAAWETYNWESQMDVLLAEYGRLTGARW